MNNEHLPRIGSAVWTGIISDVVVALGKGAAGYFSGSRALMEDALHSAANAASLLTGKTAVSRTAHASVRKDSLPSGQWMSILLPLIIMMGGLQIAVSSIRELAASETPEAPGQWALLAVIISLAVNEVVFQYQSRNPRKPDDSRFKLQSDNHRFGLCSSLIVLAGLGLSMAGASFGMRGLLYMDAVAALLVSALVCCRGYSLIIRSIQTKPGEKPLHDRCADYLDTIQRVYGVITVEDLKIREEDWNARVSLEIKVSVNPRMTVWEAHEIADRIEKLLLHRFFHVAEAQVIVVPYEPGYPYKSNFDLMDNDLPTIPQ